MADKIYEIKAPTKQPVDVDEKRRIMAAPVTIGQLNGEIPTVSTINMDGISEIDIEEARAQGHSIDIRNQKDIDFVKTLKKL